MGTRSPTGSQRLTTAPSGMERKKSATSATYPQPMRTGTLEQQTRAETQLSYATQGHRFAAFV